MIKVFIIDDSMVVRNAIGKILKDEPTIKVIGEAPNPIDAFEVFKKTGLPDVFILDIEMPKMDGLTFFKQINSQKPTPVIICSTLVENGSQVAIDSLRLGAVDIILKPKMQLKEFFQEQKEDLIRAVTAASLSHVQYKNEIDEVQEYTKTNVQLKPSERFVVIGSSTGGVQVIEEIVSKLKPNHQGIVITQHMPEGFTSTFAERLNRVYDSVVVESQDDELICSNKVIIARGGVHTEIKRVNGEYYTVLRDYPRINSHRPSVNALFKSASKLDVKQITAFILTGMGDDGASGIKKLRDCGFRTYGQSRDSCVVYGMSQVANKIEGVDKEVSIEEIIDTINRLEG